MKKKIAILALALTLVAAIAIGGSLAWLTDETEALDNTFTVGNVNISLEESLWEASDNKIVPGGSFDKNPTVTVEADSESCYVYILVENDMVIDNQTVAGYTINDQWDVINRKEIKDGDNVTSVRTLYKYNTAVDGLDGEEEIPALFTQVNFEEEEITMDNISVLNNKSIKIVAYAHQADNTDADTAAEAWADGFSF